MNTKLRTLLKRIEQRPIEEFEKTIREFAGVFPDVETDTDIGPAVELVERVGHREGLGECLIYFLLVRDPLLGTREFILRAFQHERIVPNPFNDGELAKFVELDDCDGGPIFPFDHPRRVVIECLEALVELPEPVGEKLPERADDPDTARKQKGLELWNAGKSWPEVTEALGDKPDAIRAVKAEIKRFADSSKQTIRVAKPGAKKRN